MASSLWPTSSSCWVTSDANELCVADVNNDDSVGSWRFAHHVDRLEQPVLNELKENENEMKHLITITFFGLFALTNLSLVQCVADYDFGAETLGVSPNPELGEQFDPGVVGLPYEDILHILLPEFVLDIDSTLPFFPHHASGQRFVVNIVLVDLDDIFHDNTGSRDCKCSATTTVTWESLLLHRRQSAVLCCHRRNANRSRELQGRHLREWMGDCLWIPLQSRGSLWFICAVFGRRGCTDSNATKLHNPNAVVDDGSCLVDCAGDVNGDGAVTVGDLLQILAEFDAPKGAPPT